MGQEKNPSENKPKKGWLKTLNNLLYEEDTTSQDDGSSTPASSTTPVASSGNFQYTTVAPGAQPSVQMPNASGMFDEKFYASFLKLIEDNNIEGVDYLEYSKAKKALDNTGMADPLKYQAAFSSLQANSNLTKERLIETADFYLDKLAQEEKSFNEEMQHEVESQVGSRLNSSKSKQEEISKKQEEINKLQGEMANLQTEIGVLSMEAQQVQIQIDSTAKNFKVSLDVLRNQIAIDKQNINTYIQK